MKQKIAYGGHSVLRWIMDKIFIRITPAGNIKSDKKSTKKIDGAVTTIMNLDPAIRCGTNTDASVYDDVDFVYMSITHPTSVKMK